MTPALQKQFNMKGQNRAKIPFAATALCKVLEGIVNNSNKSQMFGHDGKPSTDVYCIMIVNVIFTSMQCYKQVHNKYVV